MSTVEKIKQVLLDKIASGELAPGVRINESKLEKIFQVSRTPVREALLALAVEGFVEVKPRAGIYVSQLTPQELLDIFEVLSYAEGLCAFLVALRITTGSIQTLKAIQSDGYSAYLERNVDKYNQYNQRFHEFLYQLSGNSYLVSQIQTMRKRTGAYRQKHLSHAARMKESWFEHQEIVRAIEQNQPEQAQKAALRHIVMGGRTFQALQEIYPDWFAFATEDTSTWFEYGYFKNDDLIFPRPTLQ